MLRCLLALVCLAAIAPALGAQPVDARQTVAIVLFPGVQVIDVSGPYDVFSVAHARGGPAFRVVTVAATAEPVTALGGLTFVPDFTAQSSPPPDVLVVPGGLFDALLQHPGLRAWVHTQAARATVTLAVCNGAFVLAELGLLDGRRATTTAPLLEELQRTAPAADVVGTARVVDAGAVVTTGGLTAGIDGALHVVDRLVGPTAARVTAATLEHDWPRTTPSLPGQSPRRHIVRLASGLLAYQPEVVESTGNERRWTARLLFHAADDGVPAVLEAFARDELRWTKRRGRWIVRDVDGRSWTIRLTLDRGELLVVVERG